MSTPSAIPNSSADEAIEALIATLQQERPDLFQSPRASGQIDRLIGLAEVLDQTGLSKAKLYELIKQGEFARPVSQGFGGRWSRWSELEVQAWVARKLAERSSESAIATANAATARARLVQSGTKKLPENPTKHPQK